MDISKTLAICFETWSRQKSGYIFISKKYHKIWKDYAFKWPEDKESIIEKYTLLRESDCNLYWCPSVFKKPHRLEKYALPGNVLYADLDPVPPEECSIRPTVAWKSSSDRYQALWYLDEELEPNQFVKVNQKLTYHIGADKSGWDLTQVLRIPGTYNYKYNPPIKGKLLWIEKNTLYNKEDFSELQPVKDDNDSSSFNQTSVSFIQLLSKYRKKIGEKISRLLQYPENRIQQGSRSDMLWTIENELVKKQIPLEDIVLLIKGSAWNKYRGRKDEDKRILTEVTKIYNDRLEDNQINMKDEDEDGEAEDPTEDDLIQQLPWTDFSSMMSNLKSKPGWLVRDIWLNKSHGMVAGEPKTFKSTLVQDLAVSVASGKPFLGMFPVEETGPVMIIQNENAEWIIKDRNEKILNHKGIVGDVKVKGKRIYSIKFAEELPMAFLNNYGFNFNDPLHVEALEQSIAQVKPIMIVFDPLYLMFDGEINSAKELNPVLQWLLDIRNTYNTAVVLIHHWNKGGTSQRGGQRMLGSATLHGWTESAMYLQNVESGDEDAPEQTARIIVEREYRGAGILPKLEIDIKMGNAGDPTYEPTISTKKQASAIANELLDLLSMYPQGISISQASNELNISRRAVQNLMEKSKGKIITANGPNNKAIIKMKGGE